VDQKRLEREKWYNEIGYGSYDASKYQSQFSKKILEQQKIQEAEKGKKAEDKNKKMEKMLSYAKIVKEMHKPDVSSRKREEMNTLKTELLKRNQKLRSPSNRRSATGLDIEEVDYSKHMSHVVKKRKKKMVWSSRESQKPQSPVT